MSEAPAPRFARPFVAVFLAAIVVCGVFTVAPWPLPGWQLFSHVRTGDQSAWSATAVDGRSREVEYPLGNSERGYRGFSFLMNGFAERSPAEQQELCDTWREGTEALLGFEAREV